MEKALIPEIPCRENVSSLTTQVNMCSWILSQINNNYVLPET